MHKRDLHQIHLQAWQKGVKSLYYCRSKSIQRADVVASNEGIWECSFVGECSEVCPQDVDPAAAIQQTKIASTMDYFLSFLMPWRKP